MALFYLNGEVLHLSNVPYGRAIPETGVTIMQMDVGLDTGDMLYKASCPDTHQDTSASLYAKLAELGPKSTN